MSIQYWYSCDVNPVPWQMGPAGAKRGANGKTVAWVGRDEELHTYKEAIKESLRQQGPVKLEGELSITCFFWRNRTESTSAASGRKIKKSVADGTNMLKSTEDACQGILFDNDKANKVGRFFVIEQGPEVAGLVVICIEPLPSGWERDAIQNLPDQLYLELFGTPEEKLAYGILAPKTELAKEDDEYSAAEEIF
jgi:Holliday junction resolvase RusA-like endonuclease